MLRQLAPCVIRQGVGRPRSCPRWLAPGSWHTPHLLMFSGLALWHSRHMSIVYQACKLVASPCATVA
jgi:hypothetical protein